MKTNGFDQGQAPNAPQKTKAPSRRRGAAAWLVPAALILLSVIPLAGGAFRLNQLASGAEITPANARFFASPLPVVLHIVGASVYALLGAFQFVTRFRNGATRLAPGRRAAPDFLRTAGWVFRAVDDPVLSTREWWRCISCMPCGSCLGRPWSFRSSSPLPPSGGEM